MADLTGKIVILTAMKKIPDCCAKCYYYNPNRARQIGGPECGNLGVCMALLRTTSGIHTSKERLERCPLTMIEE